MATLRGLVEAAWVAYLEDQGLGTENIYAGMAVGEKAAPCVVCSAVSAEEDDAKGNFRVMCRITAKGLAQSGLDDFNTLCENLRAAIGVDDLHTQLTAAQDGLTVWGTASNTKLEWDTAEDCWTESTEVELYCAAHQFAA